MWILSSLFDPDAFDPDDRRNRGTPTSNSCISPVQLYLYHNPGHVTEGLTPPPQQTTQRQEETYL